MRRNSFKLITFFAALFSFFLVFSYQASAQDAECTPPYWDPQIDWSTGEPIVVGWCGLCWGGTAECIFEDWRGGYVCYNASRRGASCTSDVPPFSLGVCDLSGNCAAAAPPPPVCTYSCDSVCPAGCTVLQDPDCACQGGNGCCGIDCTNVNDSDCLALPPPPPVCAARGGPCAIDDQCCSLVCNSVAGICYDPTLSGGTGASCYDSTECASNSCVGGSCAAPPAPVPGLRVELTNPLRAETFEALLNAIINFIFWIGMTIAPIILIIAGFLYVTSAGSPQRIETAKKMMLYAVIGLAVLLFAKGLVVVLQTIID